MINNGIIGVLRCSCCSSEMMLGNGGKSLFCMGERRHCYDFSSSGYLNFSPAHSQGGDSKEAVRSRSEFLDTGAYKPISDAICKAFDKYLPKEAVVADAGCGEGYYSCRLAGNGCSVLGFDLSKEAVNSAAKRAKREGKADDTFFSVASVYSLPLADNSCDALVNIFAPCAEKEYFRVLKNGGILVLAYAGREHLMGLKRAIYDDVYENEERADMPEGVEPIETIRVRYDLILEGEEKIKSLFSMTPYYWRTSLTDRDKLEGREKLNTEIDVMIAIYKKKED